LRWAWLGILSPPGNEEGSLVEVFGEFELLSKLAQGGMAELFFARHTPTSRLVVVKRLLPEIEEKPEAIDLFLTEADIGRMLDHENLVRVLDAGEADGRYYLAMEYVDGLDVDVLISDAWKREAPIPPALALRVAVEALRGLDSAHHLKSPQGTPFGLVHRDVSPDNIFVTVDGVTKVADFGIAKLASIEGVTAMGFLKGKMTYMSPEQVRQVPLDGRADMYCLALILYEALSGKRPFSPLPEESELNTLLRVKKGKVESLARLEPDLPRSVTKLVDKALRATRWLRFPTCGAFADALEKAARSASLYAPREALAEWVSDVKLRKA